MHIVHFCRFVQFCLLRIVKLEQTPPFAYVLFAPKAYNKAIEANLHIEQKKGATHYADE